MIIDDTGFHLMCEQLLFIVLWSPLIIYESTNILDNLTFTKYLLKTPYLYGIISSVKAIVFNNRFNPN